ncbi:MAG TPA: DUF5681 domain-containing protein [Alphaproteobacteria bacterium]|jgi:hypothetical protein
MTNRSGDAPEGPEEGPALTQNEQEQHKVYDVGYGKPPQTTQFAKGRSGNPRGRPKKPKVAPIRLSDAPSDMFLQTEIYRPVTVRENGKTFQLPLMQALLRGMSMAGLKGSRLSQQYLLELAAAAEERHFQSKVERYKRLAAIKHQGEKQMAEHKRRGLPPPQLLPHPDDIVLKPEAGEAYVNGPETPEEARRYDDAVRCRNYYLLRAAHSEKTGAGPKLRHEGQTACLYLVCAATLDKFLPGRLRLPADKAAWLICDFESLSRREREARIGTEFAQLNAIMA